MASYVLTDSDRVIVEATLRDVTPEKVDQLAAIHSNQLKTARRKIRDAEIIIEQQQRNIAIRELALNRLTEIGGDS